MGEVKVSTFPHVLKEYNPDYEPYIPLPDKQRPKSDSQLQISPIKVERQTSAVSQKKTEHKSDSLAPPPSHRPGHSRGGNPSEPSSPSRAESSRSTGRKSGKSSDDRYIELSQKWDQAKQDVRLEDHDILREKIVLQQELIKCQDQYAEQRRQKIAGDQTQQRQSAKARKLAQEAHLKEICKQSLEEDRKSSAKKAGTRKSSGKDPAPSMKKGTVLEGGPKRGPLSPGPSPGFKRAAPFRLTLPDVPSTPIDAALEDPEDEPPALEVPKDVPWHEQQLYRLYGRKADYFLHPKIEKEQQVKKSVNPKLRRQGGRAGAAALWSTLREDSTLRLLKEDASIPTELKECYGAFARQTLQRHRMPVRRMFYAEDDLPEMGRLIDKRAMTRLKKRQHKTDLMYRASVSNQDRTEVLQFNNPPPHFGEAHTASIAQYLPSWADDGSEGSIPEYYKWVSTQRSPRQAIQEEEEEWEEEEEEEKGQKRTFPTVTQSYDEDLILFLSRKQPARSKPKYVFLSEKDTTVPGEFSHKYKEERTNKGIPRPYEGDVRQKAHSSLDMSPDSPRKHGSSLGCSSAPLPDRHMMLRDFTSSWEPLSMHALVEYKRQLSTLGEGDFNHGRTKMWARIPVV